MPNAGACLVCPIYHHFKVVKGIVLLLMWTLSMSLLSSLLPVVLSRGGMGVDETNVR